MTVMDPISIAGLASLAAPYVAKGLDALSKSAGEKIGGVIGDLCQSVADKFKGDSYAEQTLERAKEIPDSEERQGALKNILAEKMKADPNFAEKVKELMDGASKAQAGAVFDQRDQTVQGPQTNIGISGNVIYNEAAKWQQTKFTGDIKGPVISGQFNGPLSIGETTKFEAGQIYKESKALLTARLAKLENDIATVDIINIGRANATNIRISLASRKKEHVCESKCVPIPNSTNIPAGESISIPIKCTGWKEINADIRWTDDSCKDNKNVSHIMLEPI
jgi:hypothetical protein